MNSTRGREQQENANEQYKTERATPINNTTERVTRGTTAINSTRESNTNINTKESVFVCVARSEVCIWGQWPVNGISTIGLLWSYHGHSKQSCSVVEPTTHLGEG